MPATNWSNWKATERHNRHNSTGTATAQMEIIILRFHHAITKTSDWWDTITTWIHKLSHCVHFLPSRETDTTEDAARSPFKTVKAQNGLSDAIISDRDPKFISHFYQELISMCGVKLNMSSTGHFQTDEAAEVMNHATGKLFCWFCAHRQRDWDILLSAAENAYNLAVLEDLADSPYEADSRRLPHDFLAYPVFLTGKQSKYLQQIWRKLSNTHIVTHLSKDQTDCQDRTTRGSI